jgi:hypothetical protein
VLGGGEEFESFMQVSDTEGRMEPGDGVIEL